MENPIKIDDLGVPLFLETPITPFIGARWPKGYPFILGHYRGEIRFHVNNNQLGDHLMFLPNGHYNVIYHSWLVLNPQPIAHLLVI